MGGVFRLFKSITSGSTPLQPIQFKDSAGVAAPEAVNKKANEGMSRIVTGQTIENEVEAPPTVATVEETLLKKKKKGRYSTLLTGSKGALGSPDIERKSLLGS